MLKSVTNKITSPPITSPSLKKQIGTSDFNAILDAQTKQSFVTTQSQPTIAEPKSNSTTSKSPVDFTNMTPNEFGELVKSGQFSELPPILLPKGLDLTKDSSAQMEASLNTKVNYIELVQKQIDFNKSIGASTEYLDKQLNLMKNFNA